MKSLLNIHVVARLCRRNHALRNKERHNLRKRTAKAIFCDTECVSTLANTTNDKIPEANVSSMEARLLHADNTPSLLEQGALGDEPLHERNVSSTTDPLTTKSILVTSAKAETTENMLNDLQHEAGLHFKTPRRKTDVIIFKYNADTKYQLCVTSLLRGLLT